MVWARKVGLCRLLRVEFTGMCRCDTLRVRLIFAADFFRECTRLEVKKKKNGGRLVSLHKPFDETKPQDQAAVSAVDTLGVARGERRHEDVFHCVRKNSRIMTRL